MMPQRHLFSLLFAALALPNATIAQTTTYEKNLQDLQKKHERELKQLRDEHDARLRKLERSGQFNAQKDQAAGRRGVGQLGQTTIFDSTFNPAFSLVSDLVLGVTDQPDTFETANQFNLRGIELGVVGRVDQFFSYQVYLHFEQSEVEIEEGYLLADAWLPDTFMLKAGRYNMDFGKLSPVHEHDLPFIDKPQVLQEFLGGALRGTGAELHHYFSAGDATLVRWSFGVVNALDGDAHAQFGPAAGGHEHDEHGAEPFGKRNGSNFAFNARASALFDVGQQATLQIAGSIAHAPEEAAFFESGSSVIRANLEKTIFGGDITFKTLDPQTGSGLNVGLEALVLDHDHSDDGSTVTNVRAKGGYGYVEVVANNNWSFGASAGYFEHAENSVENSFDVGVFLTHRINEFNRLRLEARQFDDPGQDSYGLALQWTMILGSHGHGIDW